MPKEITLHQSHLLVADISPAVDKNAHAGDAVG